MTKPDLEAALRDAIDGMQEMLPYVPAYFVEKWELDRYLNRAVAALHAHQDYQEDHDDRADD